MRHLSAPDRVVEVTVRTIQGRYLLRPSRKLNACFVGCLRRAQEHSPVVLHGVVCASNHFHLLLSARDSGQLSRFMCHLNTNLSKEVGRLHDWSGTVFDRRYRAIEVSDEEAAQVARLKYLLSHGCKEGVVTTPGRWPGVHSVAALLEGSPLRGRWVDRTRRSAVGKARQADCVRPVEVELEPLPSWRHLSVIERRQRTLMLVREIEAETMERHRVEGTTPTGVRGARRVHPHARPVRPKRSPAPRFHAIRARVRRVLEESYRWFEAAYREAADAWRAGHRTVRFPPDSFPPSLPFVPWENLTPG